MSDRDNVPYNELDQKMLSRSAHSLIEVARISIGYYNRRIAEGDAYKKWTMRDLAV
jgi:hypothetical protein